jgi:hypothetical protein
VSHSTLSPSLALTLTGSMSGNPFLAMSVPTPATTASASSPRSTCTFLVRTSFTVRPFPPSPSRPLPLEECEPAPPIVTRTDAALGARTSMWSVLKAVAPARAVRCGGVSGFRALVRDSDVCWSLRFLRRRCSGKAGSGLHHAELTNQFVFHHPLSFRPQLCVNN